MTERSAPRLAWRDSDIVLVATASLLGLIAIAAASFGAHRADSPARQTAWLHLAIVGLALTGLGIGLWLLRGRRAVGDRRVALISLEGAGVDTPDSATARPSAVPGRTEHLGLVRAAGMDRLHHRNCPLVAGKPVVPVRLGDGERCGVCCDE